MRLHPAGARCPHSLEGHVDKQHCSVHLCQDRLPPPSLFVVSSLSTRARPSDCIIRESPGEQS